MSAIRMDGKMVSAKVRGSILEEVNKLKEQGKQLPPKAADNPQNPGSVVSFNAEEHADDEVLEAIDEIVSKDPSIIQ